MIIKLGNTRRNNDASSLNDITKEISNMYTLSARKIDTIYMKKNTKQKQNELKKVV